MAPDVSRLARAGTAGLAGALLLLLAAACSESDQPLVANEVVSTIPWPATESATYRVTQDDIEGQCVLTIEVIGAETAFGQACEGAGFTDTVTVVADSETLRPLSTERTITGPEGTVSCEATYDSATLNVTWTSPDDLRRSQLDVPQISYDTWGDLFLWRTLQYGENYDQNYIDVASCTNPRAEPETVGVRLTVDDIEQVAVPLGSYETWRLQIRSEGQTQDAWYSTGGDRILVKYDNGDQVFELVALD